MLLNSDILAHARCIAGKVCGIVQSTCNPMKSPILRRPPETFNCPPFSHPRDWRPNFCKEKSRFSAIFLNIFPLFFSERPVFHSFFQQL